MKNNIANLMLIIYLLLFAVVLAAQETSILDAEMVRIQQEFEAAPDIGTEIPQSKLLNEILKPGNELLLEQIKNLGPDETFGNTIEEIKEEIVEEDDLTRKEEDEKKRLSTTTSDELSFEDRIAYYESIKEFYGYNVFLNNILYYEKSELPVNSKYSISPGDELLLTIWGEAKLSSKLIVSAEGTCFIPEVGVISVHGFTIGEFESRLKKLLARHFKTIAPPNGDPTTFFDISYQKMSKLSIFINGEVVRPGAYTLEPRATVFTALVKANGITAKGTLRNIKVIRNGKVIKTLDFYDYLQTGESVNDIRLQENDNIFIGTRKSTISLEGEVLKPLKYELLEHETLADLIKYSGGVVPTASIDRVSIERITPYADRLTPAVFSKIIDKKFTTIKDGKLEVKPIKLYDHDVVKIHVIPRILTEFNALNGAVYRKGRYAFETGMTVENLIAKAGGVLADAYLKKVELVRTFPNMKSEYINLDLTGEDMNFKLRSLDSLNVYSRLQLQSKDVVIISGYVKNPGFHYLNDSTRVADLIFSRGGIEDKWRKNRTYLPRAILTRFNKDGVTTKIIPLNLEKVLNEDPSDNIILQDGDKLHIYNIDVVNIVNKVSISGFVKNEGEYLLDTNMTIEDLVLKSNGFKEGAYNLRATVFRMNTGNNTNVLSTEYNFEFDKQFFKTGRLSQKYHFYLQHNDHVVIRKNPNFHELRKVYISGEVTFPGVYSLLYKDESLRDLIKRAGGFSQEAFMDGITFERDSIYIVSDFDKAINGNKRNDIFLKNGDNIFVPKHPGTVSVEGYVYTPGLIKYRSDWGVDDYIEAAGGTIQEIGFNPTDPVIYYSGGNAKVDSGWLFSPKVKEGSKIVVKKVQNNPRQEWLSEVRAWLGAITSALTIILIIDAVQ